MQDHKVRDIVVIGASAGGIEALMKLVSKLPGEIPISILIVVHIPPEGKSMLPYILSRKGNLPAVHPRDGDKIETGRIYVAPPNQHMVVEEEGTISLNFLPRENGFRPAVNPLFLSAARVFGPRVMGVILSGNLSDGTAGLLAIQQTGGMTVVQDPQEALYTGMPASALESVPIHHVLPAAEIATLIIESASVPMQEEMKVVNSEQPLDPLENENSLIGRDIDEFEKGTTRTQRSVLTCPDCGGVLWEISSGDLVRYRCHVGHIFSPEGLVAGQDEELEEAFWTAIRSLVERAALAHRLAKHARARGNTRLEEQYTARARHSEQSAELIRNALLDGHVGPTETHGAEN